MKKLKIYLDNCCLNRPFDDQLPLTVRMEAESVLFIQDQIKQERIELVWSSILDLENEANPFESRKKSIRSWRNEAILLVKPSDELRKLASTIQKVGLKPKDSLHVASAIISQCDYLITTDHVILKKNFPNIAIVNPIHFVQIFEKGE